MKKYIIFKLNPACTRNDDEVCFARLELEAFFPAIKPLVTLFEILNYADIKTLIEHDTSLQRILTQNLSYGPYQAFLAATEDEKAIEKAIKRLAFSSEIILLQRSHDPILLYLQYLLTNQLALLHSVYNWHVFQISSLQHNYEKLRTSNPPILHPFTAHLNERQIKALVNWNIPGPGVLYDAAPEGSLAAIYAAAMGIPTYAHQNERYYSHFQAPALDGNLLIKGLTALSERLKELMNEYGSRQTHLFFNDIHQQFHDYKNSQQKKIKSKQLQKLSDQDLETIFATKFLVENKIITANDKLNCVIKALLMEAVALFTHKQFNHNFFLFLNENFKRFTETQHNFHTVKEQYASDTRQIEPLEDTSTHEFVRFDGIIDLSPTHKPCSAPVVDLLFGRRLKHIPLEYAEQINTIENLDNTEIKNLGPYLGKSLLYLKSINAREAFRALVQIYLSLRYHLNQAQIHLNERGRFCTGLWTTTTPVIEIDMERLFNDIAEAAHFIFVKSIPIKIDLSDKKIYIILFQKI